MEGYPEAVLKFLQMVSIEHGAPAFIHVDHEGIVIEAGGQLDVHGLADVAEGILAEERLNFLVGLLPIGTVPVHLPAVETAPSCHADVHVVESESGAWIILFDRSREVAERRVAQQLANDMSLLRDDLARRHTGLPGSPEASDAATPIFKFSGDGETHAASVVTIIFHDLARIDTDPAELIRDLAVYSRAATRPMVDEAGLVHGLLGDQLRVTFGALPTTVAPATLAVTAARRMLGAIDDVNAARNDDGKPSYHMSIGIASGQLAFGLIAGPARRVFTAVGDLYLRSDRLARMTGLGNLLIDRATFDLAGDDQRLFGPAPPGLGGADESYMLVLQ
ncbi:MAG TPA: hypothetical protein PLF26_10410 [Blastocatellia bacterium]|nr:hypothetical protein [Blastocatellia bacterium]